MTKGTSSFGKRGRTKSHGLCGRCGRRAFHYQKARCASCGFGKTAKLRHYNWALKSERRRTTGTGRTTHLRYIISKAKVFKRANEKYAASVRAARIRALKKPIW